MRAVEPAGYPNLVIVTQLEGTLPVLQARPRILQLGPERESET